MKYTLNLATRSYVNRKTLYLGYAVIGALLLVVLLFNTLRIFSLNSDINQTAVKIKAVEANLLARSGVSAAGFDQNTYANLLVTIQAANEILQRDSFHWTNLLDRMESVVPRDVLIVKILPNHKEMEIKLSGQSKNLKSLKRFIDNLIKSGYYDQVFLEQQARIEDTKVIRFNIRLEGAFL